MLSRFRQALTVTRDGGAGEWVDGIWVPGAPAVLTIRCSVQPSNQNDMEMLPEGRRDRQAFTLYGKAELKTADDNAGTNADRIEIYGAMFEVMHVARWTNGIINHFKSIAVKEAEQ